MGKTMNAVISQVKSLILEIVKHEINNMIQANEKQESKVYDEEH